MSLARDFTLRENRGEASDRRGKGLIFVTSGPSGSGKTTLIKKLLSSSDLKGLLIRPVSLTTRPKRKGEENGKDYHFLTREELILKRKSRGLLESTEYLGHLYGTEKRVIRKLLEEKKNILLCLDTRGAFKIKRMYPDNSVLIFILPATLGVLRKRLLGRSKEKNFSLDKRLEKAKEELLLAKDYDYRVINDRIERAVKRLKKIIFKEMYGISIFGETLR